ncbi:hypothetical protein CAEBREN_19682 [Caenorhabditis brenneri]|uniref:Uncharacterized protein n=1 Tax=Caenorhabditis brenneri TaxID=135651 RepID=G0MUY6_CAEBE|nr:hypothetical protein CAEBREN_19682 [Caenorhabditis brenneri]
MSRNKFASICSVIGKRVDSFHISSATTDTTQF